MSIQQKRRSRASLLFTFTLALAVPAMGEQGYVQHNLVSDIAGLADRTDPNLINAWGVTRSATGPWWVNAADAGKSIVLDGSGTAVPAANPLVVTIPPAGATGTGSPTGIVFNGTSDFAIVTGRPARFIFATEDGTLSGWNPAVDPTHAVIKVNNSGSAGYKGLAMGSLNGQNVLYAANFRGGTVDVFDASYSPVAMPAGAFMDGMIPQGYAPFNVQSIGGAIFVSFAKLDAAHKDEVAGPGLGYVDKFTTDGTLVMRVLHGPWFNAPWAVTLAPQGFGRLSGRLLVGNFGSGQIASFDASNGEFKGMLRGRRGKPITIDGLWGLGFGNGGTAGPATTLYFAAGIQDEEHGLFGTLTPVKVHDIDEDEDEGHDVE